MPGEDEARVGLSAQLANTALTTTTTSSGGSGTSQSSLASSAGVAGASSSSSSSVTATGGAAATSSSLLSSTSSSAAGLPKVPLPALAAHSYGSTRGLGVGSGLISERGSLGLGTGSSSNNSNNQGIFPTTATTLTPIAIASYSPGNNTVTTVNNNFSPGATTTTITPNTTGAGILSNINNPGSTTVDGGLLNNKKQQQQQQQSFQNNPLGGGGATGANSIRPGPLLANLNNQNNSSGSLVNNYNKQHQYPLHQQYQQQPQLSLKPIIATPNGNPSSAPIAETNKRDTGTCNGHGRHPGGGGSSHHGGGSIDDEIDEAGDSSKLELQLQFAGIDNETAVDVDVEDEENNYEGIESGPMCTVVPTSKRNGNGGGGGSSSNGGGGGGEKSGGGGHPSSSFPGGDVPSAGSGTMVVSSAAAAGSAAAATSTASSTTLGGAGGAGPTNSLAAAGTTTGAMGGSSIHGDEEAEDEEEDVEGGKTVECTEVVVPIQSFAEKCLFYTTAFFILLAVFSLFAFLFLVPFVIDPAFTTIFMEFDPEPAFCQTVSFEQKEGLSNCTWTSCREGCTREVYQCKQIRVNYRSARKSHSPDNADFQQEQLPQPQQLRRPNNNNNNLHSNNHNNLIHTFIDDNYHGGSSLPFASSDLRRSSEHSGSSFNTPFINNNNYNNMNENLIEGGGGGGVGGLINTYHSASSTGSGGGSLRDTSSSKISRSAHYKSLLMNALHHSSKYAVHSSSGGGGGIGGGGVIGGERDLTAASLISHMNSASAVSYGGGIGGGVAMSLKAGKHNRMASQHVKSATVQQGSNGVAGGNGVEPFWDYTGAHLFPNVKGCGYPPVVVCSDFVDKYGKEGTNFSCYYSKVDRALVVTQYDMSRVIMDLIYSMAIPIPSFIISVVYLIFAYFRIYNTDTSSPNETGGGGRAERLNSSSTTTNLQNPGSANRGGGGSSADDPDAETSLSVDDKTCIIQRSTSGGLNALSNKLPNSGKGLHAQVIEMNDLNPTVKVNAASGIKMDVKLRHPADGDVFLPQKRNNNCSNNPANPERNGPTNPAAKNKGEETTATPAVEAS